MDFQAQYLQAMRQKAPGMFNRLNKSGDLDRHARLKSMEAEKMFRDLTRDAPKEKDGQVTLQSRREAEEYVRAVLLDFQDNQTTLEEDERKALLHEGPILSPERTTE
jgi:hypothetical protein